MKNLKNVKKIVMEIAQTLAQNEDIIKLLYNDNSTVLEDPTPTVSLNDLINEHYVCVCAPVESGIKDSWKNTFLTILLDTGYFNRQDDNVNITLRLYVSTDEQHLLIDGNRNRLFELLDNVISTLDGKKFSSAGTLIVNNFSHTMLSEFRFAYSVSISFADQVVKKVEI